MTTILPPERTGLDVLGKYIGQGMQNAMPQMYENQKYQRGMQAIDQLQASMAPQIDPMTGKPKAQNQGDILANLARALTANPALERSGLAEYIAKVAAANASQNVPLPNARQPQEPMQVQPRQQMPGFLAQPGQPSQFFPSNIAPQVGPGNVPQEATSRQKVPIKTPQQLAKEAPGLAQEMTAGGEPTKTREAYEFLKSQNDDAIRHNAAVDKELEQRVKGQQEYGKRGMEYLSKHLPNASPELETIFQKKAEERSRLGDSEADINRYLDKEAQKIANATKNITSKPSATRSYNLLGRSINGTYRNFDKAAEDIRREGQPLIEMGLYDYYRKLVTGLGYYPEEREIIVNPLAPAVESSFNELPAISAPGAGSRALALRPEADLTPLKASILKAKDADPNFSLVLGRKMADDKGYTWSEYKDALNQLEQEGMQLTDDQSAHRGELDNPPVSFLTSILQDLNIIGR